MSSILTILAVATLLIMNGAQCLHIPSNFSVIWPDILVKRSNSSIASQLQADIPVDTSYPWQKYLELFQFEDAGHEKDNFESMVIHSIITCGDMFRVSLEEITRQMGLLKTDNPSLIRYSSRNFQETWRNNKMFAMFQRWAQLLGVDPWDDEDLRQSCLPADLGKLRIYYGDPPAEERDPDGQSTCETRPKLYAYNFVPAKGHKSGVQFICNQILIAATGIALCPNFFNNFRTMDDLSDLKWLLGPPFEFGYPSTFAEPTFFSARILLHELLHYRDMYIGVVDSPFPGGGANHRILDVNLVDPADPTRRVWVAYGSFFAQMATKWEWVTWLTKENPVKRTTIAPQFRAPIWNVDNWVYFMAEHYVKTKLELSKDWTDSPDKRLGRPQFPPGHLLGPADQPQATPTLGPGGVSVTTSQQSTSTAWAMDFPGPFDPADISNYDFDFY